MQIKPSRWMPQASLLIVAALATTTMICADGKSEVPYPSGFRSWQHVKSIVIGSEHKSFPNRGGIHHYYANDKAMEGYRTGKFANGSVIVDEAVFTKDGEGQGKGITFEGERRGLDVMVKNDEIYKDTGGWGFDHFDRDNKTGLLPASGQAQCHGCHKQAERDQVFSKLRP